MNKPASPPEITFLFKDHPTPMCVADRKGLQVIAINKALLKLFKTTRNAWAHTSIEKLFPGHGKDLKKWARHNDAGFTDLGILTAPQFPSLLLEVKGSHIQWQGTEACLFTLRDVAAALKNTSLYNDFHNAIVSSSIVSRVDVEGSITYVNDNFVKISGYKAKELIGQNHRIISSGHHPKSFWTDMWKTIASGNTWRADVKNKAKDGSYYWVDTFIMPFLDDDGNVKEYLSIRNNITDKKFHEEKIVSLVKQLRDYTLAVNNASIVSRADRQGNITYINSNFTKISGYKAKELIGKNHHIINSGHHPKSFWIEMWKTIASGKTWRAEVKNKAKDGRHYWVDTFIMPLTDEHGHIKEYLSIRNDITEKKQNELVLQYKNQLIDDFLENIGDGFFVVDDQWNIVLANPVVASYSSYTPEQLVGKNLWIVFPDLTDNVAFQYYHEVMRTGIAAYFETTFRGYTYDMTATRGTSGLFIYFKDVTQRKALENRLAEDEQLFRLLYNNAPTMMHSVNAHWELITVSDYWLKDLGYTREEVLGRKSVEFLEERSRNFILEQVMPVFKKEGHIENIEVQFVRKNGEVIDCLLTAISHYDTNGKFIQSLAVITNITERKRSEKEMRKLALIANYTANAVVITDALGYIEWVNEGFTRITEYTLEEVKGKKPGSFLQGSETEKSVVQHMHNAIEKGEGFKLEILNYSKSGRKYWLDIEVVPLYEQGRLTGFIAIELDITTLKESLEEVKKSDESLRSLASNIPNGFLYQAYYKDGGRGFYLISDGVEHITGYPASKFFADPKFFFSIVHPDDLPVLTLSQSDFESLELFDEELRIIKSNGEIVWVQLRSKLRKLGENNFIRDGFMVDITRRKLFELEDQKNQRLLAVTSHINEMVLHTASTQQVYEEACSIVVEQGGFRMAWAGVVEEQTSLVKPVAISGFENGYLSVIPQISVLDIPEGRGPTGTAFREKRLVVNNNFSQNPTNALWQEEAANRGYASSISLPVLIDNQVDAVFTLYSSEINFFAESEVKLLQQIVENISFAVETIRNEEKRKEAERLLIESEERFRGLIEDLNVGVLLQGLASEVILANHAACDILGLTDDQLKGKTSLNPDWLIVSDDGNRVDLKNLPVPVAIHEKKPVRGVTMRLHRPVKNDWVWLLVDALPRFDAAGEVVNVVCTIYDITEIKRTQLLVEESEERFRTLTSELNVGVLLQGMHDEILFSNEAAHTLLGVTIDQLLGKSSFDPDWKVVHEDGSPFLPDDRPSVKALLTGEKIENIPMGVYRPVTGDWAWVLTSAVPLKDGEGKIKLVIVSLTDITQQKALTNLIFEKEEQLRLLTDNLTNSAIYQLNDSLEIDKPIFTFISKGIKEITGHEPSYFIEDASRLLELIHPDDIENIMKMNKVAEENQTPFDQVFRLCNTQGDYRWIRATSRPRRDSDGFSLWDGIFLDITNQKLLELKALEQQKILQILNAIQAKYIEEGEPSRYFDLALSGILQLTGSEYGFIGEVHNDDGEPYLKTHAITNIAWSDETRKFYEEHAPKGMEFRNLKSLFGEVMTTAKPVIANDPYHDPRRGGLPEGYPPLNAFLGIPIMRGEEMVGMIGLANAPGGYSDQQIELLQPLTSALGSIIQGMRTEILNTKISEELKQTTERLNLAIDASGLGVWHGDFIRNIYIGNERIKEIYGIENTVVPIDEFWKLIHPEDRDRKRKDDLASFASDGDDFGSEYKILRPSDGSIRYLKAQGIFFKDDTGKIVSGVSVVQDQTKDKEYKASLLNSIEEKEMLIKEIHHRVKNNLQLISSMLYLKMLTWENPESKSFMVEMREKIKSVSLIHERLLQTESLNAIDIHEYLKKLLYDIQVTYFKQELQLKIQIDIEKIYFSTDYATYLGQLINELVTNAIKHAFVIRQTGEITIVLKREPSGYRLQVSDNGVGLPLTADPSKPRSYGMQLVQIFVKQLKGTLQVTREGGTSYIIHFKE